MHFPITTALERLLVTERHRRQADESSQVGFAVPALSERVIEPSHEPLVVSDGRGRLVPTRVSRTRGVARYGFFECATADEGRLIPEIFATLWKLSTESGWDNRCTSLTEAVSKMRLEPRSIVVPYGWVERAAGVTREEADRSMALQGFVSKGDQQVLVGDLPDCYAIVAASPPLVGFYTRIDDRLGLMLTRVDQTLQLVRQEPQ